MRLIADRLKRGMSIALLQEVASSWSVLQPFATARAQSSSVGCLAPPQEWDMNPLDLLLSLLRSSIPATRSPNGNRPCPLDELRYTLEYVSRPNHTEQSTAISSLLNSGAFKLHPLHVPPIRDERLWHCGV